MLVVPLLFGMKGIHRSQMQEGVLGKYTVSQVEKTSLCTGEKQCLKIHLEIDFAIH